MGWEQWQSAAVNEMRGRAGDGGGEALRHVCHDDQNEAIDKPVWVNDRGGGGGEWLAGDWGNV